MEIERIPFGQSPFDKLPAAHYRWVNIPTGLTPELAGKPMLGLHGGKTVKDMTSNGEHHICSFDRFNKHCELNPEWGLKPEGRVGPASSRRKRPVMFWV
jgi:hypothetical protein